MENIDTRDLLQVRKKDGKLRFSLALKVDEGDEVRKRWIDVGWLPIKVGTVKPRQWFYSSYFYLVDSVQYRLTLKKNNVVIVLSFPAT